MARASNPLTLPVALAAWLLAGVAHTPATDVALQSVSPGVVLRLEIRHG